MKLFCPIQPQFIFSGVTCIVNQLFGENKNQLFYDERGHMGLDLQTQGEYKFRRYNQKFGVVDPNEFWKREDREVVEKAGFIPIIAAHDGYLTTNAYVRDKQKGWGMFITTDAQDDGYEYMTMYWHIESPWRSLGIWSGNMFRQFKEGQIRQGSIIAIAGNTGQSTGAHLHFELHRRKAGTMNWEIVDPMPYMDDDEILYQRGDIGKRTFYYKGKEIQLSEFKQIINNLPKMLV